MITISRPGLGIGLATALLVLAGCASGDDTEPRTQPEPTETKPTGPPPQPEGADGVTWEIENWDEYAEDEAVLAWKRFSEGMHASVNAQELLPAARDNSSSGAIDAYQNSFDFAVENDYTVPVLVEARVESVERDGPMATLVACAWAPTVSLYRPDGAPVSDDDVEFWSRNVVTLSGSDETGWLVDGIEFGDGRCEGEPPA